MSDHMDPLAENPWTEEEHAFAREVWEYMDRRSCPGIVMNIAYEAVLETFLNNRAREFINMVITGGTLPKPPKGGGQ